MTQYDSQIFVIFSWLRSPAPGRKHSEALLLGLTVPRWNRFNPLMDTGWRSLHCWDSQTPEKLMLSNGSSHLESTKTNIKMKWNHLHNDSGISQDICATTTESYQLQARPFHLNAIAVNGLGLNAQGRSEWLTCHESNLKDQSRMSSMQIMFVLRGFFFLIAMGWHSKECY